MENFAYFRDPDHIDKQINYSKNDNQFAVEVKNVEFQYQRKTKVLDKLSLQIPRGSTYLFKYKSNE